MEEASHPGMAGAGAAESPSSKGHPVPSTAPTSSAHPAKLTGSWMSARGQSLGMTYCGLGGLAARGAVALERWHSSAQSPEVALSGGACCFWGSCRDVQPGAGQPRAGAVRSGRTLVVHTPQLCSRMKLPARRGGCRGLSRTLSLPMQMAAPWALQAERL